MHSVRLFKSSIVNLMCSKMVYPTHALDPYCSTGMSCVHLLLNILYSIGTILLH